MDMSEGLEKVLKDWMELQDLEATANGKPTPEILFPGETLYMHEDTLRYRLWHPLLKQAGIRRLDIHCTRHTFASRLIQDGVNLKYISEQLGHSSIRTTVDIYGHLIPGGNRQAVNRLDEMGVKMGNGETDGY